MNRGTTKLAFLYSYIYKDILLMLSYIYYSSPRASKFLIYVLYVWFYRNNPLFINNSYSSSFKNIYIYVILRMWALIL